MDVIHQTEQLQEQIPNESAKKEESDSGLEESLDDKIDDYERDLEARDLSYENLNDPTWEFDHSIRSESEFWGRHYGSGHESFMGRGQLLDGGVFGEKASEEDGGVSFEVSGSCDETTVEDLIKKNLLEGRPPEEQAYGAWRIDEESYRRVIDDLLGYEWDVIIARIQSATEKLQGWNFRWSFEEDVAIAAAAKKLIDDLKERRAEQRDSAGLESPQQYGGNVSISLVPLPSYED